MAQDLWPSETVFLTPVGEDVVVLDVAADRYACLLEAAGGVILRDDGGVTVLDSGTANALQAAGLLADRPPVHARKPVTAARRSLSETGSPGLGDVLGTCLSLSVSTIGFRRRSLADLASDPHCRPRLHRAADEAAASALVSAWRAAAPWVPGEGECLQRAFLLRRRIAARGVGTDWVFGVRTWPFSAHCWLQIGDLVVGDTLDRVGAYAPIMAV